MHKLIILAAVGLAAQLIDGSLGMGYGVTSTTMLLLVGLSPALASASVHLAEIGTNAASAVSHWRLGNVDRRVVIRLGIPGAVGAFVGATALSGLSTTAARPATAGLLLILGCYILVRFSLRPPKVAGQRVSSHGSRFLAPLGLVGGFVDATGGGGWGPVATSTLLGAGKTAPRTVVGSVDTAEFMVSVSASAGFLAGLGAAGIDLRLVAALLAGGLVSAPVAAWLVSRVPARLLGTLVGGFIVISNLVTFLPAVHAPGPHWAYLAVAAGAWAFAVGATAHRHRRDPTAAGSSVRPEPNELSRAA